MNTDILKETEQTIEDIVELFSLHYGYVKEKDKDNNIFYTVNNVKFLIENIGEELFLHHFTKSSNFSHELFSDLKFHNDFVIVKTNLTKLYHDNPRKFYIMITSVLFSAQ